MNLPISMNPKNYGEIISISEVNIEDVMYTRYISYNGSKTFRIDITQD